MKLSQVELCQYPCCSLLLSCNILEGGFNSDSHSFSNETGMISYAQGRKGGSGELMGYSRKESTCMKT